MNNSGKRRKEGRRRIQRESNERDHLAKGEENIWRKEGGRRGHWEEGRKANDAGRKETDTKT